MTQESFSVLWGSRSNGTSEYLTDKDAMRARNARMRELRKQGIKCRGWAMRNQVRQYWSFGNPCGDSCTVYMISIDYTPTMPIDVDTESAYGSSVRLSRSVRVF